MCRRTYTNSSTTNERNRCCGGVTHRCWSVARRCLCTAGWYPLLLAPIITAGCLLSLYSSMGCQFIDLHVGFTPSNAAWNVSRAQLGLFYYHDSAENADEAESSETLIDHRGGPYSNIFHEECLWYTSTFQETIIERDRTWRVARVMAMIAISTSVLSTLTIWLIVLVPVPALFCVWPGILLPNMMLAFIAEGSKFLFFDIALCRNSVWFPSGIDSWPEEAESCQLHTSSYFGIAAAILHFIALVSICVHAPKKRTLDPNYSHKSNKNNMMVQTDIADSTEQDNGYNNQHQLASSHHRRNYRNNVDDEDPSILDEDMYTAGPSPANESSIIMKQSTLDSNFDELEPGSTSPEEDDDEGYETGYGFTEPMNRSSGDASSPTKTQRISASRMETYHAKLDVMACAHDESQQRRIAELLEDLNKSLGASDGPYE